MVYERKIDKAAERERLGEELQKLEKEADNPDRQLANAGFLAKAPAQVVRELEALRRRGWRDMVFIVDDNFIGHRKRAKELLREIIDWRARTIPKMGFLTEASMNLADDAELCELMARAGFKKVFMGIETPSEEGLQECNKLQNRRDLSVAVKKVQRAGMEVMGGFIVGFDSDPRDIFRRQFEFIQQSGVVTAMVVWTATIVFTRYADIAPLRRAAKMLVGLLGLQLALGVAAYWAVLYQQHLPQPYPLPVALTVAHVVNGALTLATAVWLTLAAFRVFGRLGELAMAAAPQPSPRGQTISVRTS